VIETTTTRIVRCPPRSGKPRGGALPASTARFRTPDDIARDLDPDDTKIKSAC
jgi:hypothetical protein